MIVHPDDKRAEGQWESAKRILVVALFGLAAGLAVAGSVDQRVGGVVVVAAFGLGVVALHRLGRAGSTGSG